MPAITKAAATKLVRRFDALTWGLPKSAEGIEAYVEVFMAITGTQEQAEALAGYVIRGCSRCPTPIELRKIFSAKFGEPADGIKDYNADASDYMIGGGTKGAKE